MRIAMPDPPVEALLDPLAAAVAATVERMVSIRPRVHAILSPVAQPFVANVAAALGIDVSMTADAEEVAPMAAGSQSLLVNLGMMDRARREGVVAAASTGVRFVLDPVKVDRSPTRLGLAHQLIAYGPAVVKGNAAEMAALAPIPRELVAVTTGATDVVVRRGRSVALASGTPLLDRVIATGCAAGFLIAAALAVEDDAVIAAVAGLALLAVAGEEAAGSALGPGSFAVALIDALAAQTGASVAARMRAE